MPHSEADSKQKGSNSRSSQRERGRVRMGGSEEERTRRDRWGYPVRTASEACIDAIDAYYEQVLAYGRDRAVILRAATHDRSCTLANALAAHFVATKKPQEASRLLHAANASLVRPNYRSLFLLDLFACFCKNRNVRF